MNDHCRGRSSRASDPVELPGTLEKIHGAPAHFLVRFPSVLWRSFLSSLDPQ